MRKNSEEFFYYMEKREPPKWLLDRIMLRIVEEKRQRAARARILCFGAVSLIAFFAFVPAWKEFYAEFVESGFSQFISLLFSDAGNVFLFWQDFAFSLLESFPAIGASALLLVLFAFLFSLRFIVRDMGVVFRKSGYSNI